MPEGFRFCGTCGHPIDEPIAEAPGAGLPSERRPVTVLFADLVGFSTLAEHMDPEELRALMTDTFAELSAEVEKREGTVEKFIGDAVMAVFGVPHTHEDDPGRAVDTALAMLDVARRRSERTPAPVQLRIGVNSGLVVSGTVGDGTQAGIMGDAVNVAARLQQTAGPGELVVSDSVWRRVRSAYDAQAIGELDVKGREQPVPAHRVLGRREAVARKQAPFVGRRDELALLELLWSSAVKGNTHVVSLVGEPGVGKSRLLSELPLAEAALDIRIACGSERAFGPFLEVIERILGGLPSEMEDLRRRSTAIGVEEETTSLLSAFLGLGDAPPVVRMADEQQKRQVFAGVWQFLLEARGERPALIVLDDVHWADLSSLDLLGFLLERLSGVPLMLVLAYRPGFERVEQTALRASHTGVRLEPLTATESVDLARGFLGVLELPSDLERIIVTRAEGNPFFIEELLQALLELGSLAVVDGRAVLAKVEMEIPDTVQGTILARVDRLGPAERAVLHHAAVLGRSFSTELIDAIVGDGQSVAGALEELTRAQLVVAQGPDRWAFKHALIQEVTYETLLLRQRKELHRKIAEALEERAADDPASLEVLAEHYARAEVPEKARAYAVKAGDMASQRMGFVEAKGRYETALRLWGEGDEEGRLDLMMNLAQAALLGGDEATARTTLVEAEARWRELGNIRKAGAALASLGRVYWVTGESDRGAEVLSRAVQLLEPEGPSPELVWAFVWTSTLNMLGGRVDVALSFATRGLAMAEQLAMEGAQSHLLNNIGCCECFTGDPSGLDRIRRALELAESSGEAEAIGRAHVNLPSTLADFSYNQEAVALCRKGREVMRKLGSPTFEWFIAANEAFSLVALGEYRPAEALARAAMAERSVLGAPGLVNAGGNLGWLCTRLGRFEEARQVFDEILPLARGVGGAEFLSRFLRGQAELEEARGNLAAARQAMEEAVQIVFETPSTGHWFMVLPQAARLLPKEEATILMDRVAGRAKHRAFEANVIEAEGYLTQNDELLRKAADMYRSFELPYEEARCRLEAGEPDRAREIIERYGLHDGPLGALLRERRGELG